MTKERARQLIEAGIWLKMSGDLLGANKMFEKAKEYDPDNPKLRELFAQSATDSPAMLIEVSKDPSLDFIMTPPPSNPKTMAAHPSPKPDVVPPMEDEPVILLNRPTDPTIQKIQVPESEPIKLEGAIEAKPVSSPPAPSVTSDSAETVPPKTIPDTSTSPPVAGAPVLPLPSPQGHTSSAEHTHPQYVQQRPSAPSKPIIVVGSKPHPVQARIPPPSAWEATDSQGSIYLGRGSSFGGMLDFVTDTSNPAPPEQRKRQVNQLLKRARDLMGLDDHTGAHNLAANAVAISPDDPQAKELHEKTHAALLGIYQSKLGPLTSVPKVKLREDELIWLNLDHRAGFLLSLIDGRISYEELFEISSMSRFDTAQILAMLIDDGILERG